jgi:hypothetical protein
MAIQDEMYRLIEQEINQTVEAGKQVRYVNYDKAKEVARMLTSLSTETSDADSLTNQYIAKIKIICNSQDKSA